MTGRRRPGDDPPHGRGTILVHAHWRTRVDGIAAPAVCSVRAASEPDIRTAGHLLDRAGSADAVLRHARGTNLLLLAWLDPDRLPAASGSTRERAAGATTSGVPWPAGCLDIDWSGPRDNAVRADAGECVELGHLHVDRAARGHGVGHALVAAAEQHCLAAGRTRVVAALRPTTGPGTLDCGAALSAAERAGYRPLPVSGRWLSGSHRTRAAPAGAAPTGVAAGGLSRADEAPASVVSDPHRPRGTDRGAARDADTASAGQGRPPGAVVWVWKDVPELGGPYPTHRGRR